ncbi:uncharacterized protein CEXT_553191 [Caerostris extrusa]|uniref:Uncharacterized protein n=1 Tax=Caerostris extrusa TaxID=172846 RepID=A0AAV4R5L4_CAEEX|nr:uncharacterized protein CEXT_553191 [Caerostris extrusa]
MGYLQAVILCAIAFAFVLPPDVHAKAIVKRREVVGWCSRTTPCGWEVYRPFMRTVEYFIPSPCECQEGTHCVRVYDDISISAYVHRCRAFDENIMVWPHDTHGSTSVS